MPTLPRGAVLALALAAAGCSVGDGGVIERPHIVVERLDYGVVELSGPGLTRAEALALADTIAYAAEDRPEALEIVVTNAGEPTRVEIASIAAREGVPGSNVILEGSDRRATKFGAGTKVYLARYVARPPTCYQRVLVGGGLFANKHDPEVGCATLTDLALSVANPKDLLTGDGVVLQDGRRAVLPVRAYRNLGELPAPSEAAAPPPQG